MFPRSAFHSAVLCLTLLTIFIWYLSASPSTSKDTLQKNLSGKYLQYARPYSSSNQNAQTFIANQLPLAEIDEPADDPIRDIHNSTLGFQKIYAVSMPHRADKRDYLALMGLISGLDIEFADGVNGSEIHPKSLPSYWKGDKAVGDYGCWRAHMNVYQHMVQNRIQSALILEDDVDWDVLLRHQMVEFARGARAVKNATLPLQSPYGDDWDLLTLGHIGVHNKPNRQQKYWVTRNDPTVIAESRRKWWRKPDLSTEKLAGEHTRLVMEVSKMSATTAYGISLRGAATLLYDQTLLPNAQAIDMAMLVLCRHDTYGSPFCLGAYPMIFGRYRAIGPKDRDSDRRTTSNEAEAGSGGHQSTEERLEAESEFTVFPVSLNIGRMIRGEWILPASEPDLDLVKQIDLRDVVFPRGGEVEVGPEEYRDYQAMVANRQKEQNERAELKKDGEKLAEAEGADEMTKTRRWTA